MIQVLVKDLEIKNRRYMVKNRLGLFFWFILNYIINFNSDSFNSFFSDI